MRVFVAIDMPDAVCEVLEGFQDHLSVGRFADSETLHLTLAFLGDQPRGVVGEVHEALDRVRVAPFDLQLQGLGTFGSKSPRVLWAGVAPCPELARLRDRVRAACRSAGVELARERFRPHVTLARFGQRVEGDQLEKLRRFLERFAAAPMPGFRVNRFELFESHLRADGARHDLLAEYALADEVTPSQF